MNSLATAIATFCRIGFLRPAPGTLGSIAAVLAAALLLHFGGRPALAAAAGLAVVVGWWATSQHIASKVRPDDPAEVVIDEVAGVWLALLPLGRADPAALAAGLVLFRLLDIWKPGPIGWADRHLKGAAGVMADDIIAGGFAALCLAALLFALGRPPW